VLASRERLVTWISNLKQTGHATALTAKAESMLTRWWARANWSAREELLRTAEWMLRLEGRAPMAPAARSTKVKRDPAREDGTW
jgi:hypothetical protein